MKTVGICTFRVVTGMAVTLLIAIGAGSAEVAMSEDLPSADVCTSKVGGGTASTVLVALGANPDAATSSKDLRAATFAKENAAAMSKMMAGMHAASSGDVDRDFAAAMTAHHQGAIDMARSELRHGSNEQLRRIAQQIVVEQQQEIEAMQRAVRSGSRP